MQNVSIKKNELSLNLHVVLHFNNIFDVIWRLNTFSVIMRYNDML